MFRNERQLLEELTDAINSFRKQGKPLTEEENKKIEKHRDNDGFINLKNVNNIDEIVDVMNLVDRKNYIENLCNNKKSVQTMADELAKELMDNLKVDNVKVNIETPEGKANVNLKKDKENPSITPTDFSCDVKTECSNKNTSSTMDMDLFKDEDKEEKVDLCSEKQCVSVEHDKDSVVLLCNACEMDNPLFYNALLHICDNMYFYDCGVYSEYDTFPENVDTYILIPNVWGKILSDEAEYFAEQIKNGKKIYIINPEIFSLTKINNISELWDYAMTDMQEKYW